MSRLMCGKQVILEEELWSQLIQSNQYKRNETCEQQRKEEKEGDCYSHFRCELTNNENDKDNSCGGALIVNTNETL